VTEILGGRRKRRGRVLVVIDAAVRDDARLQRAVVRRLGRVFDLAEYVLEALNHAAEYDVLAVQMSGRLGGDKELHTTTKGV
jgi:hypothetical protein